MWKPFIQALPVVEPGPQVAQGRAYLVWFAAQRWPSKQHCQNFLQLWKCLLSALLGMVASGALSVTGTTRKGDCT